MQKMSLSELKAENAKLDQAPEVEEPQTEIEELEHVEAAEVVDESVTEHAESETEKSTESEVPAWMQTEDDESIEKKFTHADIGAAKKKLKAKLEKQHESEVETLRAEIERLKAAPSAPQSVSQKPKRDDFYDHDDPDEAYLDALSDWKLEQSRLSVEQQQQQRNAQEQAELQQRKINESVEDHYTRAAKMLKENGISEELFNQAELNVIDVVEQIFPQQGQQVTANLLGIIGDDSEKVMYYLGRNKTKLMEFEKKLREDPTGFKAAVFLGQTKSTLSAPIKRKSNAPKAAPELKGDVGTTSSEAALIRKYKEAHKSKNPQKAFQIKREAKQAGFNTREW